MVRLVSWFKVAVAGGWLGSLILRTKTGGLSTFMDPTFPSRPALRAITSFFKVCVLVFLRFFLWGLESSIKCVDKRLYYMYVCIYLLYKVSVCTMCIHYT